MTKILLTLACLFLCSTSTAESVRLKDLGRIDGWRENYLVGLGVVTGLAGTGDSARSKATRQSIANLMSNFDIAIASEQINSRNVAIVSIIASLPPVTRPGDRVDVVVTSLGDARSLVGGTLLLSPLKGPDGQIYALAQGPVSIGGYRYDQNGNVAQKNHPTVGNIPGGAQIEAEIASSLIRPDGSFDFVLSSPDYTTGPAHCTRHQRTIQGQTGRRRKFRRSTYTYPRSREIGARRFSFDIGEYRSRSRQSCASHCQ